MLFENIPLLQMSQELDWKKDEKSVSVADPIAQVLLKDKGFSGEVESFGHGLQRPFLIVILQELMSIDSEISPTLILGCEEPELYQHPPHAKHLAAILMELSFGDAQIMVATHSPYFIDVDHYAGTRQTRHDIVTTGRSLGEFSNKSDPEDNCWRQRLTQINGKVYGYDGNDNRLKVVQGQKTSYFIYDSQNNLLAEADENKQVVRYFI